MQSQVYKQNNKRPQPGIVEIEDSDDEVEVAPTAIRKIVQTNPSDGKSNIKDHNNIVLEESEKE